MFLDMYWIFGAHPRACHPGCTKCTIIGTDSEHNSSLLQALLISSITSVRLHPRVCPSWKLDHDLLYVVVVVLAFIDVSANDAKPGALQGLNVPGASQRATFVAG